MTHGVIRFSRARLSAAPRGKRILGALLDLLISGAAVVPFQLVFALAARAWFPEAWQAHEVTLGEVALQTGPWFNPMELPQVLDGVRWVASAMIWAGLMAFSYGHWGTSPGKRLLGLYVDQTLWPGSPRLLGVLREGPVKVLAVVLFPFLWVAGKGRLGLGFHDGLLGTRVLELRLARGRRGPGSRVGKRAAA